MVNDADKAAKHIKRDAQGFAKDPDHVGECPVQSCVILEEDATGASSA